jgi:hypothetical protein
MKGHYAVLGWGSLIWDLDDLAPHVTGPWLMGAGPCLPMEFTRVSPKRKMGLAVCLDPEHGVPCPTHVIASRRDILGDVVRDVAARERTSWEHIGGVCLPTNTRQGRDEIGDIVADWCASEGWRGAVWTDLLTNYQEALAERFSVTHAVTYLQGLSGESLDEAVRYIENAPKGTDTPLRRALATEPWWQNEAARLRRLPD